MSWTAHYEAVVKPPKKRKHAYDRLLQELEMDIVHNQLPEGPRVSAEPDRFALNEYEVKRAARKRPDPRLLECAKGLIKLKEGATDPVADALKAALEAHNAKANTIAAKDETIARLQAEALAAKDALIVHMQAIIALMGSQPATEAAKTAPAAPAPCPMDLARLVHDHDVAVEQSAYYYTVPLIAKDLGVKLPRGLINQVGRTISARYQKLYGERPSDGSVRLYPASFRADMEEIIRAYAAQ